MDFPYYKLDYARTYGMHSTQLIQFDMQKLGALEKPIARILVFAFDLTEAAQLKRIDCLRAAGHNVRTVSFRRKNWSGRAPEFPNLDLGKMPNERLLLRLWLILKALPKLFYERSFLADADVVIARNFDLLALAWITRQNRTPLIYECLDIHSVMTGGKPINRIMRVAERFVMRRIQLLWTSSPGFLVHYFEKIQEYRGPSVVVENKLWFGDVTSVRPAIDDRPQGDGCLILGWVGSIRCQASFDILCDVARAMPAALKIEIHGAVHHHAITDFQARLDLLDNMSFHGPYAYPEGLAEVYKRCDLVWAQDLWQRGGNSDWLLPNRIYEASWYGCPSIAVAGTQTGQRVQSEGLGPVISMASTTSLQICLQGLDRTKIRMFSESILQKKDAMFQLSVHDVENALSPVLGRSNAIGEVQSTPSA